VSFFSGKYSRYAVTLNLIGSVGAEYIGISEILHINRKYLNTVLHSRLRSVEVKTIM
jgi:hypothetical protein